MANRVPVRRQPQAKLAGLASCGPLTQTRAGLCNQSWEVSARGFQARSQKTLLASSCSLLDTFLWEKQLPCQEDTPAALLGRSTRRGAEACCCGQHYLASRVEEPTWKWILQPQSSLRMSAALGNLLAAIIWRHWARTTQLSHSQIPDPPKLGETV